MFQGLQLRPRGFPGRLSWCYPRPVEIKRPILKDYFEVNPRFSRFSMCLTILRLGATWQKIGLRVEETRGTGTPCF